MGLMKMTEKLGSRDPKINKTAFHDGRSGRDSRYE